MKLAGDRRFIDRNESAFFMKEFHFLWGEFGKKRNKIPITAKKGKSGKILPLFPIFYHFFPIFSYMVKIYLQADIRKTHSIPRVYLIGNKISLIGT